ncbi:MAG: hypothetical protein ACP5UD_07750 [Conexivisphaera sp.]
MKFKVIRVRLEDYAAPHVRRTGGYFYTLREEGWIPAQTLRGAVLRALMDEGRLGNSALDSFSITPAFPAGSAPSHALSPALGRKCPDHVELPGSLRELADAPDAPSALEREYSRLRELLASTGGVDLRPAIGRPVREDPSSTSDVLRYKIVEARTHVEMHVAVSKSAGSAESGMLFAYEYLVPPSEYWALSPSEHWDDHVGSSKLYVTLGKSRGTGSTLLEVAKEVDLDVTRGGWAYCLSQCLPSLGGFEFFSMSDVLGSSSTYLGWFTRSDGSGTKPALRVISQGSLVLIKDAVNLGHLWPAGLNFAFSMGDLNDLLRRVTS